MEPIKIYGVGSLKYQSRQLEKKNEVVNKTL